MTTSSKGGPVVAGQHTGIVAFDNGRQYPGRCETLNEVRRLAESEYPRSVTVIDPDMPGTGWIFRRWSDCLRHDIDLAIEDGQAAEFLRRGTSRRFYDFRPLGWFVLRAKR